LSFLLQWSRLTDQAETAMHGVPRPDD
jgi:hypothetical protein